MEVFIIMSDQFVKCTLGYFAQDGRRRCNHTSDTPRYWNSEVFLECHDKRWCKPEHNDQEIFVQLRLEMFSAGLSFAAILEKEANIRKAFGNFDPNIIVNFDAEKIGELMVDSEIIRNLKKYKQ